MKKIGIITYHEALNFGAAFQCKALYQFVKDTTDKFDVAIIDYTNKEYMKTNKLGAEQDQKSAGIKGKIRILAKSSIPKVVKKRFCVFFNGVSFSEKVYNDEFERISDICDYYIIGSDQLWNFELNGGDTNYLLPGIDKKRVITYATSIGQERIKEEYVKVFVDNISDIQFLSVREQNAQECIKRLLPNKKVELVLDPVFLLNRDYWLNYTNRNKKKKGICLYLFHKAFLKDAYDISAKLGFNDSIIHKVCGGININDIFNPNIKTGLLYGPQEALAAIFESEIVFTDSFHCVAISIIYHIDFFVFLTGDRGRDSRIRQLLEFAGLTCRIVEPGIDYSHTIDWSAVDEKIDIMRVHSQKYLMKAIDSFE